MYKGLSIALLVVGTGLIILSFKAVGSFRSEVSETLTGMPSERSLWLFVLGAIAFFVGGCGLFIRR